MRRMRLKMKWKISNTILECPRCHKKRDVKPILNIAGFKTISDGNPWGCQCGFVGNV